MYLYLGSKIKADWLRHHEIKVNDGQQLQAVLYEKLQQFASNEALRVTWGIEYDRLRRAQERNDELDKGKGKEGKDEDDKDKEAKDKEDKDKDEVTKGTSDNQRTMENQSTGTKANKVTKASKGTANKGAGTKANKGKKA